MASNCVCPDLTAWWDFWAKPAAANRSERRKPARKKVYVGAEYMRGWYLIPNMQRPRARTKLARRCRFRPRSRPRRPNIEHHAVRAIKVEESCAEVG